MPSQWELHGNLVLDHALKANDKIAMGFLFSPEPASGIYDGLWVQATYSAAPVFANRDNWTLARPFTDGSISLPAGYFDDANDWNITGEKSSLTCPNEGTRCTAKAHFNRKFSTGDSKDYQLENGKNLGYEVIGFYRITDNGDQVSSQAQSSKTFI